MAYRQTTFGEIPLGTEFTTDHDAVVWRKITFNSASVYGGRGVFDFGHVLPFDVHETVFVAK